ncbi:MAG: hypothetical protein FP827_04290 [Candidatus Omnitrophica bacterium]|nr:hypothetical protein [Candidatus Omnitrophota bacterium]
MRKLFFSLIFCLSQAYALNLGEMRTQIRETLKDTGPSSAEYYWSDTALNSKVNIIQNQIVSQGRFILGKYSTYTVLNQREYALPSDCLTLEKVSFWISPSTTAFKRLQYKSIDDLDAENVNWQKQSAGQPLYYYQRGNKIGLSPVCSVTYSTTSISLVFEYIKQPDTLSSDTDVPFDEYPQLVSFHQLIVMGVVQLCSGGQTADYFALIQKQITELEKNPDFYWNKRLYPRQQ